MSVHVPAGVPTVERTRACTVRAAPTGCVSRAIETVVRWNTCATKVNVGASDEMAAQIVASPVAGTSFQRQRNFLELQLPWKRPPEAESGFESQKFPSVTSGPYSCTRFVPQPFGPEEIGRAHV